jgi:hypothetical protein
MKAEIYSNVQNVVFIEIRRMDIVQDSVILNLICFTFYICT